MHGCLVVICLIAAGCGGVKPQAFATAEPEFEPDRFFQGRVHSWGIVEDRYGNPSSRFRTDSMGRRDAGELTIKQNFRFEDGRTQRRVWRLRQIDAHRYVATANDVVGLAKGEAFGNAFHWEYTLALSPGNSLKNVHLEHWMYLLDDGETMLNRVTITKFGAIVGQVTEYFRRGAWRAPSIGRNQ